MKFLRPGCEIVDDQPVINFSVAARLFVGGQGGSKIIGKTGLDN